MAWELDCPGKNLSFIVLQGSGRSGKLPNMLKHYEWALETPVPAILVLQVGGMASHVKQITKLWILTKS